MDSLNQSSDSLYSLSVSKGNLLENPQREALLKKLYQLKEEIENDASEYMNELARSFSSHNSSYNNIINTSFTQKSDTEISIRINKYPTPSNTPNISIIDPIHIEPVIVPIATTSGQLSPSQANAYGSHLSTRIQILSPSHDSKSDNTIIQLEDEVKEALIENIDETPTIKDPEILPIDTSIREDSLNIVPVSINVENEKSTEIEYIHTRDGSNIILDTFSPTLNLQTNIETHFQDEISNLDPDITLTPAIEHTDNNQLKINETTNRDITLNPVIQESPKRSQSSSPSYQLLSESLIMSPKTTHHVSPLPAQVVHQRYVGSLEASLCAVMPPMKIESRTVQNQNLYVKNIAALRSTSQTSNYVNENNSNTIGASGLPEVEYTPIKPIRQFKVHSRRSQSHVALQSQSKINPASKREISNPESVSSNSSRSRSMSPPTTNPVDGPKTQTINRNTPTPKPQPTTPKSSALKPNTKTSTNPNKTSAKLVKPIPQSPSNTTTPKKSVSLNIPTNHNNSKPLPPPPPPPKLPLKIIKEEFHKYDPSTEDPISQELKILMDQVAIPNGNKMLDPRLSPTHASSPKVLRWYCREVGVVPNHQSATVHYGVRQYYVPRSPRNTWSPEPQPIIPSIPQLNYLEPTPYIPNFQEPYLPLPSPTYRPPIPPQVPLGFHY